MRHYCHWVAASLAMLLGSVLAPSAVAQQVNQGVGFGQLGNNFYERSGVGFNFSGPGFFFQQSSFGQALPPFGGYAPGAGMQGGFGVNGNGYRASFNFDFSQGARTSMVSQSPSVTVGNGAMGGFSAGSWTPFVIGTIPVVGDAPVGGLPFGPAGSASILDERLSRLGSERPRESAAATTASPAVAEAEVAPVAPAAVIEPAALSVATIEQMHAAREASAARAQAAEIEALLDRANTALAADKPAVARIYLQQAASRADGARKEEILKRLKELPRSR